jgi:hypothetical protein
MAMGGVGEAMLLGAAMGGGTAALTGGDPLKGALLGGLTGGAGAGFSSALNAAVTPSVSLLEPAVTQAATQAVTPAATEAITNAATNAATNNGITTLANGLPKSIADSVLGTIQPGVMPAAAPTVAAAAPAASAVPSAIPPPTPESYAKVLGGGSTNFTGGSIPPAPGAPSTFMEGMAKFAKDPIASLMENKSTAFSSALAGYGAKKKPKEEEEEYSGPLSRFKYNPDSYRPAGYADGGIASLADNGYNSIYVGSPSSSSNMARGGIADLGSYSDGGRMLQGPGDGMSDSIPASIAGKRPARLADGEFVVPADVVSHLGNGSTDAGAKQLYAMMDKVRQARTGRKAQGREINPRQYMAA